MSIGLVFVGLAVLVAAGLGAALRFTATEYLNDRFPYGTLLVNVGASFALGLVVGVGVGDPWQDLVGIGALGALSTWSAVANEVAQLARASQGGVAVLYLLATVSTGVLAAWAGLQLAAAT